MRLRRKTVIGRIGDEGRRDLPMEALEDFCSLHKGKGIILRAEILAVEPSDKVTNYFFGYVVPEMQGMLMQEYGERYTKEQTYEWMKRQCPLFAREERADGRWRVGYKDFEELDSAEANEVIEWAVQYAAENFYQILDYPKI